MATHDRGRLAAAYAGTRTLVTATRAEVARLAHARASLVVLLAVAALVALAYVVMGVSRWRLPFRERMESADLLQFPDAHTSLLTVLLVFGGMFVAAYAGAAGAHARRTTIAPVELAPAAPIVQLAALAALAIVLLVGLVVLYAGCLLVVLLSSMLAGTGPGGAWLPPVADGLPALLARGWLATTMLAAVPFAAAVVTGSARAAVVVLALLFFAEELFALVLPQEGPSWGPFAAAALLASGESPQQLAAGALTSVLYVLGSSVLVVLAARFADRGPIAVRAAADD